MQMNSDREDIIMEDIRELGYGILLVRGKLAKVMNNSIDLSTQEGRDKLIFMMRDRDSAEDIKRLMPYGPCTIAYIYPEMDGPFGRHHLVARKSPKWLKSEIREMLKKELPEYADEFRI